MALIVALVLIGGLAVTMLVLAYVQRVPSPEDVAVSYETAWDRFDVNGLWILSGRELRAGMDRKTFRIEKRADPDERDRRAGVTRIVVEDSVANERDAIVRTRVEYREGEPVRNEIRLRYRSQRWEVVHYAPTQSAPAT